MRRRGGESRLLGDALRHGELADLHPIVAHEVDVAEVQVFGLVALLESIGDERLERLHIDFDLADLAGEIGVDVGVQSECATRSVGVTERFAEEEPILGADLQVGRLRLEPVEGDLPRDVERALVLLEIALLGVQSIDADGPVLRRDGERDVVERALRAR